MNKVLEGSPHIVDAMKQGTIAMVINTPDATGTTDSFSIRRTALELRLPYFTTMAGAKAAVEGIFALKSGPSKCTRCKTIIDGCKPPRKELTRAWTH